MRFRMGVRAGVLAALMSMPVGLGVAASAPPAFAATCAAGPADHDADVDGDAMPDLAVGVPRAAAGGQARAGAVDLRPADGRATVRRVTEASFTGLPAPRAGDNFGADVAYARVNADACYDLVVGAPGAGAGRGAVVIVLGSTSGPAANGAIRLVGQAAGEGFGHSVAVVGRNIWVSAPNRTVSGHARAGAIDHFRISGAGTLTRIESLTENSPGVPGVAEAGDRFGTVLRGTVRAAPETIEQADAETQRLIVGQPGEDIGRAVDAGAVTVLAFGARTHRLAYARFVAQGSGAGGAPEAGDKFGYAVSAWHDVLAVGVPLEDLGSVHSTGIVQTFAHLTRSTALVPLQTVSENSMRVPGTARPGDHFGAAVGTGPVDGFECSQNYPDTLVIGAPGVALGTPRPGAGSVTTLPLLPSAQRSAGAYCTLVSHDNPPRAGSAYGSALYLAAFQSSPGSTFPLRIGAPGQPRGAVERAGMYVDVYTQLTDVFGSTGPKTDSAGPTTDENYGAVFGHSQNS